MNKSNCLHISRGKGGFIKTLINNKVIYLVLIALLIFPSSSYARTSGGGEIKEFKVGDFLKTTAQSVGMTMAGNLILSSLPSIGFQNGFKIIFHNPFNSLSQMLTNFPSTLIQGYSNFLTSHYIQNAAVNYGMLKGWSTPKIKRFSRIVSSSVLGFMDPEASLGNTLKADTFLPSLKGAFVGGFSSWIKSYVKIKGDSFGAQLGRMAVDHYITSLTRTLVDSDTYRVRYERLKIAYDKKNSQLKIPNNDSLKSTSSQSFGKFESAIGNLCNVLREKAEVLNTEKSEKLEISQKDVLDSFSVIKKYYERGRLDALPKEAVFYIERAQVIPQQTTDEGSVYEVILPVQAKVGGGMIFNRIFVKPLFETIDRWPQFTTRALSYEISKHCHNKWNPLISAVASKFAGSFLEGASIVYRLKPSLMLKSDSYHKMFGEYSFKRLAYNDLVERTVNLESADKYIKYRKTLNEIWKKSGGDLRKLEELLKKEGGVFKEFASKIKDAEGKINFGKNEKVNFSTRFFTFLEDKIKEKIEKNPSLIMKNIMKENIRELPLEIISNVAKIQIANATHSDSPYKTLNASYLANLVSGIIRGIAWHIYDVNQYKRVKRSIDRNISNDEIAYYTWYVEPPHDKITQILEPKSKILPTNVENYKGRKILKPLPLWKTVLGSVGQNLYEAGARTLSMGRPIVRKLSVEEWNDYRDYLYYLSSYTVVTPFTVLANAGNSSLMGVENAILREAVRVNQDVVYKSFMHTLAETSWGGSLGLASMRPLAGHRGNAFSVVFREHRRPQEIYLMIVSQYPMISMPVKHSWFDSINEILLKDGIVEIKTEEENIDKINNKTNYEEHRI